VRALTCQTDETATTRRAPEFRGAAIDTGAQKSVIGKSQAQTYCHENGIPTRLESSSSTFVFADQRCRSLGILTVLLDTPVSTLRLDVDVVLPDILTLLGLDLLDKYGLQFLNTENALEAVKEGWKSHVIRKKGHAFIT
jgi:hypothetical protein